MCLSFYRVGDDDDDDDERDFFVVLYTSLSINRLLTVL